MKTRTFGTGCAAVLAAVLATGWTAAHGASAPAGGGETHDGATMKELPRGQVRIEALDDDLIMHTYKSKGFEGGSGSVTTFVFESGNNLLVFDTQFYKPFAEEAKAYIESLGKPVDKLIIGRCRYAGVGVIPLVSASRRARCRGVPCESL